MSQTSRKLLGMCGLAAFVLCLTSPAVAAICTIDAKPASTLLLPYFEVDLNALPKGVSCGGKPCEPGSTSGSRANTIFSINNASASATVVNVVVYSDLSVPLMNFNVYLTGYDVQTIDMSQILTGNIPQTASVGQDPSDTISPHGPLSQDINFASCNGVLPGNNVGFQPPFASGPFTPAMQMELQQWLAGQQGPSSGQCAGQNFGDNHARGYVTIDVTNACTFQFPSSGSAYFSSGGGGIAGNRNIVWGDWALINPSTGSSAGGALVHIEAAPGAGTASGSSYAADPATTTPGRYTFYGKYVNWTAIDNREPLATTFVVRYTNQPPFLGGTSMIAWRDAKVNQGLFTCPATAGRPAWYPLGQEGISIFNEQEGVARPAPSAIAPFPAETQLVAVGGASLPTPFTSGLMYIDLNAFVPAAGANPPADPNAAQAWVIGIQNTGPGTIGGVTVPGIQLDSACAAQHLVPTIGP
jgi:hypothetical protein